MWISDVQVGTRTFSLVVIPAKEKFILFNTFLMLSMIFNLFNALLDAIVITFYSLEIWRESVPVVLWILLQELDFKAPIEILKPELWIASIICRFCAWYYETKKIHIRFWRGLELYTFLIKVLSELSKTCDLWILEYLSWTLILF